MASPLRACNKVLTLPPAPPPCSDGDWNALDTSTNKLFLANAYFVSDALVLSRIASATGQPAAAQAFVALAALVNEAITARWWNATCGCWDSGSQCAQAIALAFGLGNATAGNGPGPASRLAADVTARGTHPSVGTLGSRWLFQALTASGHGDVAVALARQTTVPSWGAMLLGLPGHPSLGTLWEGWDGYGGGSSGDHIMLGGGIGEWFYSHALGLRFEFSEEAASGGLAEETVDEACAGSLGLRNIRRTAPGALRSGGACAIAAAVRAARDAVQVRGIPASLAFSHHTLLAALQPRAPLSSPSPMLTPTASLVLDDAIVRALGSAEGHITTPTGRLAASWVLDAVSGALHITMEVPHAVRSHVYLPAALVRSGSRLRLSRADEAEAVFDVLVGGDLALGDGVEWVPSSAAGLTTADALLRVSPTAHGAWRIEVVY